MNKFSPYKGSSTETELVQTESIEMEFIHLNVVRIDEICTDGAYVNAICINGACTDGGLFLQTESKLTEFNFCETGVKKMEPSYQK